MLYQTPLRRATSWIQALMEIAPAECHVNALQNTCGRFVKLGTMTNSRTANRPGSQQVGGFRMWDNSLSSTRFHTLRTGPLLIVRILRALRSTKVTRR